MHKPRFFIGAPAALGTRTLVVIISARSKSLWSFFVLSHVSGRNVILQKKQSNNSKGIYSDIFMMFGRIIMLKKILRGILLNKKMEHDFDSCTCYVFKVSKWKCKLNRWEIRENFSIMDYVLMTIFAILMWKSNF